MKTKRERQRQFTRLPSKPLITHSETLRKYVSVLKTCTERTREQ